MFGSHYLHDGAQPEGSGRRTRWGNCWVVVVLVVELPCLGGRQVGLPVLFRLFRPKDEAHPELDAKRLSQPELARTLIDMVLKRFPRRIVEIVCDGAYASKAWQALPARVSVTTRMRANAAVYALPAAERHPGQQGRTPLKGAKLKSLAKLAETAIFTAVTITGSDGRERTPHVHEFTCLSCLWYKPFYTRPMKVLLIRNPGTTDGFDVALASTDTNAAAAQLVARYDTRWTIETCHQEAKAHGVRPSPQSCREGRQANRPVRVPDADDHDRVVRRSRRPGIRPRRPPQIIAVAPPEDHHQLRRHARRAPP